MPFPGALSTAFDRCICRDGILAWIAFVGVIERDRHFRLGVTDFHKRDTDRGAVPCSGPEVRMQAAVRPDSVDIFV